MYKPILKYGKPTTATLQLLLYNPNPVVQPVSLVVYLIVVTLECCYYIIVEVLTLGFESHRGEVKLLIYLQI